MKLLTVLLLCTVAIGCGYGSKMTTPPTPGALPAITQLNPTGVVAGSQTFQLEVNGTNFASNAVINFGGTAETTTSPVAGKLQANIPSTAITTAGQVPVTVTNPATAGGIYGGGTTAVTSTAMNFTVQ
jgi:hypothetical protein